MNDYKGHSINTWYDKKLGYWIATAKHGPYHGLNSWHPKKKWAIKMLQGTIDKQMSSTEHGGGQS